jgi:transcriptional regulator with XRE-family HTH domain
MEKSLFSEPYQVVTKKLVELRNAAGLTQRELAKRLGWDQSSVHRAERGQRRLDALQLYHFFKACGVDPQKTAAELMRELDGVDRSSKKSIRRRARH